MTTQLNDFMEKISIPPRPGTMVAIMDVLQNSSIGSLDKFDLLFRHISNDPALTAEVLRKANASIYHNLPKCTNVRQAMMLLGTKNISKLLTDFTFENLSSDESLETLWNHCIRTAHLAGLINEYLGVGGRSEAYLFGLFHDCGMFIMEKIFAEEYLETVSLAKKSDKFLHELEIERHGVSHAEVGALLVEKWNFSDSVRDAIKLHHHDIYQSTRVPSKTKNIIAVGHLALCIENSLSEKPCPIIDKETLALAEQVTKYLGINWNTLDYLQKKTEHALSELNQSDFTIQNIY